MAEKTFFYVFVANVTEVDRNLNEAFGEFEKIYSAETEVRTYYPGNPGFRPGLAGFGIKKVPGFAVADVHYAVGPAFRPNPYISVDRSFLESRSRDQLFNLIRDWHDGVLAENILRIGRDRVIEQALRLFGRVWEEVKDTIQVVAPLV